MSELCRSRKFPYYLPLCTRRQRYQGRMVETTLPLFQGYIFVQWTPENQADLQRSSLILHVLKPKSSIRMLRELVTLRKVLKQSPELAIGPLMKEGMPVRVISGPFMGTQGLVAKNKAPGKVIINIEMIGQSVALPIESINLEVCD